MKLPHPESSSPATESIAATAAAWVMRQDRGLSPEEQDDFLQWLAADPRCAEAMARQRRAWEAFDRLAGLQSSVQAVPDPDLLLPRRSPCAKAGGALIHWRFVRRLAVPLAAAAAVAFVWWPLGPTPADLRRSASGVATAVTRVTPIEERVLDDGSVIRLNRGAVVAVEFSPGERRVRLERGEAAFDVVKDAARPFVVMSAGVAVRAVGTAFNVRLADRAVEVIVTEGRVAVAGGGAVAGAALPTIVAGQRAVVPLATEAAPPAVSTLSADDLSRRLAWQPRMLTFTDEPLATILNEFNRHNPVTLRLGDPALRELRLTARFRSDNVQGFLRILASDFGVRAKPGPGGEIVLRPAR